MLRSLLLALCISTVTAVAPCAGEDVGMALMGPLTSLDAEGCAKDTGNMNLIGGVWTHAQATKILGSDHCAKMWAEMAANLKMIPECTYAAGMTNVKYAAQSFAEFANDIVKSTGALPATTAPAPASSAKVSKPTTPASTTAPSAIATPANSTATPTTATTTSDNPTTTVPVADATSKPTTALTTAPTTAPTTTAPTTAPSAATSAILTTTVLAVAVTMLL
ncbi:hypothetical protein SPRG_13021 [Saprolegnia parasitica CBS 223.65]|uniref:Secreted protein n=1 Tax=Saprolegnia parasitica (strain CBS 223.65) TaxID=695850 RepID=A0A067BTX3_SAPPC|nr:hypothetical protein SPRG_13021 [Saprolegnia parasitica CBS 223.65]KDO21683.1 hypothetical protein SPRG_13021 [Saprolegnia parasitica CBS 223.65]|eukprot:XP_012207605.1 hypothetical protein SPRG_13021 [Saprolegnia parasitica CBS 223.65]